VFPTETVYGLGADARSPEAVARLVALRGREEGKPILVLVTDLGMADMVVAGIPDSARRLAARFWPGPLTLVVPARDGLPAPVTAGGGTVGVRVPGHPVARGLDPSGAPFVRARSGREEHRWLTARARRWWSSE